jgi:hypothetical protein
MMGPHHPYYSLLEESIRYWKHKLAAHYWNHQVAVAAT